MFVAMTTAGTSRSPAAGVIACAAVVTVVAVTVGVERGTGSGFTVSDPTPRSRDSFDCTPCSRNHAADPYRLALF